jgi:hypothetical protein
MKLVLEPFNILWQRPLIRLAAGRQKHWPKFTLAAVRVVEDYHLLFDFPMAIKNFNYI